METAPQLNERESHAWQAYNLKQLSYRGLIENARLAYQSYLSLNKEVSNRLTKLL